MGCSKGCAASPGKHDSRRSQLAQQLHSPALRDSFGRCSEPGVSKLHSPVSRKLKGDGRGRRHPHLPPCTPHAPPREVYSKTFQSELRRSGKERRDPGMEWKLGRRCPPPQLQVTIGTGAKGRHHLTPQPRVPSPCGMLLISVPPSFGFLLSSISLSPPPPPTAGLALAGFHAAPQVLVFPAHLKSKVKFLEDDGSGRGGLLA